MSLPKISGILCTPSRLTSQSQQDIAGHATKDADSSDKKTQIEPPPFPPLSARKEAQSLLYLLLNFTPEELTSV